MGNAATLRGQARGLALNQQARTRHIGEIGVSKSGRVMTIIEWRSKLDIDVQFDDGYIAEHRRYYNFTRGAIGHPEDGSVGQNWKYESHLGEEVTKNNGTKMRIIKWENSHNFDVQFDDGTIVHCTRYQDFKKGYIRNPNYRASIHNGEEIVAVNGLKAKIVNFIDWNHVVIQFEDGVEITKDYKAFRDRKLKHPGISCATAKAKLKYEGKTFVASNGMAFTVIRYEKSSSILIRFEDGTEVYTTVSGICSGKIQNPNYTQKEVRTGEVIVHTILGLSMAVKEYRSATDADIQFEDGYLSKGRTYQNFKKGSIEHPFPYTMGKIRIESPAYVYGLVGNFYCTCESCGMKDILSVAEMREHICPKS